MKKLVFALALSMGPGFAAAAGPLGVDHVLNKDESGIWARHNQRVLEDGSALVVLGGALWEGDDSRLGKTYWRATDSMLMADAAAAVAKSVFRRARPDSGEGPNAWGRSSHDKSFPSGEVTHITAVVTPFIAEYQTDHPAVWLLAALPAYDGVARMKSQAHWQSDVLVGMALGGAMGLYAQQREEPWSVSVLPGGLSVGFKKKF